jgi:hypothetical protein
LDTKHSSTPKRQTIFGQSLIEYVEEFSFFFLGQQTYINGKQIRA